MGELSFRLRILIAALPVAVERLWRTAFGGGAWDHLPGAVPYLTAAAAGLAVMALATATFQTAVDFPPLGVVATAALGVTLASGAATLLRRGRASLGERLITTVLGAVGGGGAGLLLGQWIGASPVAAAVVAGLLVGLLVLGWRLQIAHTARAAARSIAVVPTVISGLLVLTLLPLLQAGAELIVTRATVSQFVERTVGFSSTLIELQGYAATIPLSAEPPLDPEGGPAPGQHRWLLLRESMAERRIALLRSPQPAADLNRRAVVARVTDDPAAVQAAAAELAARGVALDPAGLGLRLLVELPPAAGAADVRDIGSRSDLDGVATGSVVRVQLDFAGEGVATCAAAGDCRARRLGQGIGPWDQLASDPASGAQLIVRTPYPPTVAPLHVFGRQTSDPGAVARFLALPWIQDGLAWARVLRGAIIEHDPSLPVDRLWAGPALFGLLAALLWLGRRMGYPVYVSTGRPAPAPAAAPGRAIEARAWGRIAPRGRSALELDGTPIRLQAGSDGPAISLAAAGPVAVTVPQALGALSDIETGELRSVTGRRPVLRASWYGSQLLLAFGSVAERDAAAAILGSGSG